MPKAEAVSAGWNHIGDADRGFRRRRRQLRAGKSDSLVRWSTDRQAKLIWMPSHVVHNDLGQYFSSLLCILVTYVNHTCAMDVLETPQEPFTETDVKH